MEKSRIEMDAESVVQEFLGYLNTRYGVSRDELSQLISKGQEEPPIPIEVLGNRALGPMEAIIKFLRENKGLPYSKISELVGRSRSTVGVMYHFASQKLAARFPDYPESRYNIPLTQIRQQEFTALEGIVMFLRERKLKVSQIAELLNRDYRTIYTIYRRGRIKNEA